MHGAFELCRHEMLNFIEIFAYALFNRSSYYNNNNKRVSKIREILSIKFRKMRFLVAIVCGCSMENIFIVQIYVIVTFEYKTL